VQNQSSFLPSHQTLKACVRVRAALAAGPQQFELRYNEIERARAVFERYVEILPTVKAWVR